MDLQSVQTLRKMISVGLHNTSNDILCQTQIDNAIIRLSKTIVQKIQIIFLQIVEAFLKQNTIMKNLWKLSMNYLQYFEKNKRKMK